MQVPIGGAAGYKGQIHYTNSSQNGKDRPGMFSSAEVHWFLQTRQRGGGGDDDGLCYKGGRVLMMGVGMDVEAGHGIGGIGVC